MNRVQTDHVEVDLAAVTEAAGRVARVVRRTPLVRLPGDEELFVKAENLQLTGSFKIRGAYNFLSALGKEALGPGVVTHSSGNHAQGVACAARLLGVPATIVIPENAPPIKVERTRAHGATIVRCGNSSDEREEKAAELVRAQALTLVPPFDHPLIVAGQGTVGLEICEDLPAVANVLVPVGGGGISSGVVTAVSALCPDAQVIGVEPELGADAAASLEAGEPVSWPASSTSSTIADGVRTQRIGDLNFSILSRLLAGIETVSEAEIEDATRWYLQEGRLVVEPTGALTYAAYRKLQAGRGGFELKDGPTVLVASGGNVDPAYLARLLSPPAG